MPQFDISSLAVQIYWFSVFLAILYYIFTINYTTNLSRVIKIRDKLKDLAKRMLERPIQISSFLNSTIKQFREVKKIYRKR